VGLVVGWGAGGRGPRFVVVRGLSRSGALRFFFFFFLFSFLFPCPPPPFSSLSVSGPERFATWPSSCAYQGGINSVSQLPPIDPARGTRSRRPAPPPRAPREGRRLSAPAGPARPAFAAHAVVHAAALLRQHYLQRVVARRAICNGCLNAPLRLRAVFLVIVD